MTVPGCAAFTLVISNMKPLIIGEHAAVIFIIDWSTSCLFTIHRLVSKKKKMKIVPNNFSTAHGDFFKLLVLSDQKQQIFILEKN